VNQSRNNPNKNNMNRNTPQRHQHQRKNNQSNQQPSDQNGHKNNGNKNKSSALSQNQERRPTRFSKPRPGQSQGRNNNGKTLSPARILQKYDNLMEQHLISRRKYFEVYNRSFVKDLEPHSLSRAEENFYKSLYELRQFERSLTDHQLAVLHSKTDNYPLDRDYTRTNNIEPKGEMPDFTFRFEDPHFLETQNESFRDDKQESVGTMDDYYKYKGTTAEEAGLVAEKKKKARLPKEQ
jgi:hypothetical protein